ncbi:MAG TPA: hypothetical protein VH120_05495 [Gemmataceae bacterium]|nr:hypothetical protein [Gemmataceae bacterium]
MKTTLELPDDLIKRVKLRALRDGRKLKDTIADLLQKGLTTDKNSPPEPERAVITTDKKTGLPLIRGGRPAPPAEELTPERVADILLAQEMEWRATATAGGERAVRVAEPGLRREVAPPPGDRPTVRTVPVAAAE